MDEGRSMRAVEGSLGHSPKERDREIECHGLLSTSLLEFAFEGFVEDGGQERGEFGCGFSLEFLQHVHLRLQAVEVGYDSTLLWQRRYWDRNLPKVIQVQFR
jgi:hypothetical protein